MMTLRINVGNQSTGSNHSIAQLPQSIYQIEVSGHIDIPVESLDLES